MSKSRFAFAISLVALLMLAPAALGRTFTGPGNFSDVTKWDGGSTLPGYLDDITVNGAMTVDDSMSPGALNVGGPFGNVTLNTGASLVFVNGKTFPVLSVSATTTGTVDMTAGGTLGLYGSGNPVASGITLTAGTGTVEYGTAGQSVSPRTYNNLSFIAAGSYSVIGNTTVGGDFLLQPGTTLTFTGNYALNLAASVEINGTITGFPNGSVHITGSTGEVVGAGSINVDTYVDASKTFNSALGIGGGATGTLLIGANVTLTNAGSLAVHAMNGTNSGSTFNNGAGATLEYVSDTLLSTGTLTTSSSPNTISYSNNGPNTVKAAAYYNLTLKTAGNKSFATGVTVKTLTVQDTAYATLSEPLTIDEDLIVAPAATLDLSTYALNVRGNATIDGTLTGTTTTVVIKGDAAGLSGGNPQVKGVGAITSGVTLRFDHNGDMCSSCGRDLVDAPFDVAGTLNINGAYTIRNHGWLHINNLTGTVSGSRWEQWSSATLQVDGTFLPTGTLDASSNGVNAVHYGGSGQTVLNVPYRYLFIGGSNTVSIASVPSMDQLVLLTVGTVTTGANTITGDVDLQSGTLTAGGNLTIGGKVYNSTKQLADEPMWRTASAISKGADFKWQVAKNSTPHPMSAIPAFNGGTYTHTVGGNFDFDAYNAQTSTVVLTCAACAIPSATTFYNLTISGNVSNSAAITINKDLTVAGNYSLGSYSHIVKGNISVTGNLTPNYSTVTLNGTAAQSVAMGGKAFHNLTVDNAAGISVSSGDLKVEGYLTLTNGKITTPLASKVLVQNPITTGAGWVNGPVERSYVGGSPIVFPVGTATSYYPVTLNIGSGTSVISVQAFSGREPHTTSANALNHYWTMTPDTEHSGDIAFPYSASDVTGNEVTYELARYNGGWTILSGLVDEGTHNVNANASQHPISGNWTIAEPGAFLACSSPAANLVSWWQAETNSFDGIGPNSAPANGSGFASGQVGQAFAFNGSNQYISVPDSTSLRASSLSIEGWVKFAAVPTSTQMIVSKPLGVGTANSFSLFANNGTLNAEIASFPLVASWSPTALTWYHVAATFDSSSGALTLYVDGVQVATGTRSAPTYDNHPLLIGAESDNETIAYYFNGLIDELTFYSRALTLAEIQAVYNIGSGGKCYTAPPVASISSFSPTSGAAGTVVTFVGSGFTNTNNVRFNGVNAAYTIVSDTSLQATVPAGATSGNISITTSGGSNATGPFTVPIAFTSVANGDWNTASTWSPVGVPGSLDSAVIDGETVTLSSNNTVQNFTFSAGTLTGTATLTVTNSFNWTSGAFGTGGGTLALPATSTGTISSSNGKSISDFTLTNAGSIVWANGSGEIIFGAAAVLNNSGTFDIQNDATMRSMVTATGTAINNSGLWRKSVATGTSILSNQNQWPFNNNGGTITVQSGVIRYEGPFNPNGGSLTAGTFMISGGTSTGSFGVNGTLDAIGGTHSANHPYTGTGILRASGGNFAINSTSSVGGVDLVAGSIGGSGALTASTTFSWTGGNFGTGGGSTTYAGSSGTISTTNGKVIDGYTLTNNGTITWQSGSGEIVFGAAAVLNNAGTFDIQNDANMRSMVTATGTQINNAGLWRKTVATGMSVYQNQNAWPFVNTGTIEARSGAMRFDGPFSTSGTLRTELNGTGAFGQLNFQTVPTFGGTLDVVLGGVYQPAGGDTFQIITTPSGAHSGDFASATFPSLSGGKTMTRAYNAAGLVLNVTAPVLPTISAVSPGSGPLTGGTSVTISGTNLDTVTSVTFGASVAPIVFQNAGTIVVTTPAHAVGLVNVGVNSPGGSATAMDGFRYTSASCATPPAGMFTWLRGEGSGTDSVGPNSVTPSGAGVTFGPGVNGQAFQFDGASYATAPDNPSLRPKNFSIELWVKFNTVPSGIVQLVSKTMGIGGNWDSFGISTNGGVLSGLMSDNSIEFGTPVSTPWTIIPGNWYHIVYTYEYATTNQALYLNGTLADSRPSGRQVAYDTNPLVIGGDLEYGSYDFLLNGALDDVTLYDRVLTGAEVAQIYNGAGGKCTAVTPAPTVYMVNPTSGEAGAAVVLTGTSLSTVSSVTFGGVAASINGQTATTLSVTAPPHVAGLVDIVVTSPTGSGTLANGFRYITACIAVPAGAVAWYRGDSGNDSIGTNHGTLSGDVTIGAGKSGNGFVFGGTNGSVNIPPNPVLGNVPQHTVEMWVYIDPSMAFDCCHGILHTTSYSLGIGYGLYYFTDNTGSTPVNAGDVSIGKGGWHHIAGTDDGVTAKVYVDGVLLGSIAVAGGAAPTNGAMTIGSEDSNLAVCPGCANRYFKGMIDEVTIYNRALSLGEIQSIYNADTNGKCYVPPPPAPTITNVSPSSGPTAGGTSVTITGTNLASVSSVTFGGTAATFTATPGSITATTPAHALGQVNVVVTNGGGAVAAPNAFQYTNASCATPPTGMFTWLRGEGNGTDSIGPNSVTLSGPGATFGAGMIGQAFSFDGASYGTAPDNPSLRPKSFSLEVWAKFNAVPTGLVQLAGKTIGNADHNSFAIGVNETSLGAIMSDDVDFGTSVGTPLTVVPGTWYHIVYTYNYDTTDQSLYLNGTLVDTRPSGRKVAYDSNPFVIGADIEYGSHNFFLNGMVDEVTLYDRALTSSEVAANFNGAGGKCTGVTPAPTVYMVNPTTGEAGASVVLTGTSLATVSSVTFGGVAASIVGQTATTITVTAPVHAAGPVDVVATSATGSGTLANAFRYITACTSVPSGAVAWYRGNSGNDSIGTVHGTLSGDVTIGAGKSGNGFVFGGTNGSVDIAPNSTLNLGQHTVEFWFYINPAAQFGCCMGLVTTPNYELEVADRVVYATSSDGTNFVVIDSPSTIGQWHHVAGTNDGTTSRLYLDGVLVANWSSGGPAFPSDGRLSIGSENGRLPNCPDCTNRYFKGIIDEVTVYNRALSLGEIQSIYNADVNGKCYVPPSPTISGVTPAIGSTSGGTSVTINGSNLSAVTSVTFGGTSASIVSQSASSLSVLSPAHAAGLVDVAVTSAGGTATAASAFHYVSPVCTSAPSGAIQWYRAEGTANDGIGGNVGTLANGAATVAGKVGQAFSFDGVDDQVVVPNAPSLTGPMSIELWMKADPSNAMNACCQRLVTAPRTYAIEIAPGLGTTVGVVFDFNSPTGWHHSSDGASGGYPVTAGTWHHVVGVYDGTAIKLYIDGTLVQSSIYSGAVTAPTAGEALYIGGVTMPPDMGPSNLSRYFGGLIDEVTLYNRALSLAEIQAIYDADTNGKCYVPPSPPTITAIRPASGSVTGGNAVVIEGTNLNNTLVSFGGSNAAVNVTGASELTVTAPPGSGTVNVTVTNGGGTATATNAFSYATDYDLARDFSLTNPSPRWTYGQSPARGAAFTPLTPWSRVVNGLDHWGEPYNGPTVWKNRTAGSITSATNTTPAGRFALHPGPSGENSIARWTAPATASYHITGSFTGNDFSYPTTTDVAILRNNSTATTLFSGNISSYDIPLAFDISLALNAGETIEFTVGYGGNGQAGDATGLDANISVIAGGLADLAITKTASAATVVASSNFTYTLQVSNAGPGAAANVSVTDTLPAGVTLNSASGSGWTCSGTLTVTCTLASLPVGSAPPITLDVNAGATGRVTSNMAAVSSTATDNVPGNNSSTASITVVVPTSSIAITSNADSGPGTLRQAILDANAGFCTTPCTLSFNLSPTTTISLLSPLPTITRSGVTIDGSTQTGYTPPAPIVVLNGSALGSGAGFTLGNSGITINAIGFVGFPGQAINVQGPPLGDEPMGGTHAALVAGPVMTISNNYIGTNAAGANLGNTGDGLLISTGPVNVTGNTIAFNGGNGITVVSMSGVSILNNSIHDNNLRGIDLGNDGATANDAGDPDTGANNLQNTPVITSAQLAASNVVASVNVDSALVPATTSIKVQIFKADAAGEGQTLVASQCFGGNSLSGASMTFPAGTLTAGSPLVATATSFTDGACTATGDGTSEFSAVTALATCTPPPVSITSSSDAVCPGGSVLLDAGSGFTQYLWSTGATTQTITVFPTATTTYSVTVKNAIGCTNSASKTITFNPAPAAAISGPTAVCAGNPATLTASGGTSYLWSTGATTTSITVTPTATSTYSVNVTDTNGCSATASHTVNVSVPPNSTITAPGSVNANSTGNTASVTPPPGATTYSWSISGGTITAGVGTPSITFTAAASGSVTLGITMTTGGCSSSSTTVVTIIGGPANADLSITKTASPQPVTTGAPLVYTVTVMNNGPGAAQNVTVTDTLPAGVSLRTTGGPYACGFASGTLTCSLASLASGSTAVLTINATAPASAGSITNTASVSSTSADPVMTNNTASVTTTVNAPEPPPACPSTPARLVSPADGATGVSHSVTFTWTPVSNAISYTVHGTVDGGPLQDFGTVSGTSNTLQVSLTGSNIVWFVRARFVDCPSIDSAMRAFTLEAPDSCDAHLSPTLQSPTGGTIVSASTVDFRWNSVPRANEYRVWVSIDNGAFAALETTQETTLRAAIPYGRVDWYVEALFLGCPSTESIHATFNVPKAASCNNSAATLLAPANGTTVSNRSVELAWQQAPNAIGYEVYLSVNSGTPTLIGSTTATTLAADVSAGSLRWFVRSLFNGCDPVNSQDFTFDFTPPPACPDVRPILTAPAQASVGLNSPIDFTWSASPRAQQYRLRYTVDGGQANELTTTETHLDDVTLPATGAVEWSVTAITANCPSLQSTIGAFTLAPRPPACTTPETTELRAAANASTNVDYAVRWNPIPGAVLYEIQESPSAAFTTFTTVSEPTTSHTFRHANDTSGVTVYFFYRVRGVNECNATRGQFSEPIAVGILPPNPTAVPSPVGATPVDNPQTTTYQLKICTTANPSCAFLATAGQTFTATTDQPWLTVTPTSGSVPAGGITLIATANPASLGVGTNTAAVNVVFTSPGATSGGKTSQQSTSSNSTTNVSVNLVSPVAPTPSNTPPPDALIIPAVAHASGLNSKFESDIRVTNTSPQPMKYQLTFTPTGDSGITEGKQTTIDIDPGKTVALDDVLDSWFGAAASTAGASGALEIRPITKSSTSVSSTAQSGLPNIVTFATSRTYSLAGNGSLGTIVPAIPYANFIGKSASGVAPSILSLQQIAQNANQRTNFGLKEGSGQPATVLVSIFGNNGQKLGSFTQNLTGGQHLQINSMLARQNLNNVADGRIEVQVMSATGKVTAYASVLDNQSNDAQLVSPVSLSQQGSAKFVLAGVADQTVDGAKTQTDVRLFNASSSPVTATLQLYRVGTSQPQTQQVTLAANEVKTLDNVVQSLFGSTNIGTAALHVNTANPANLIATARTYSQTSNGTLGQFMSAVTPANAITSGSRPLQLLQIEESNRFSTDVGIAEISGKAVDLEITVIPQDSKVSAKTTVSLQANQFQTMNGLLKQIGLDNSYNARVAVRVVGGAGAATAYASVRDKVTNDLTFVPAQ